MKDPLPLLNSHTRLWCNEPREFLNYVSVYRVMISQSTHRVLLREIVMDKGYPFLFRFSDDSMLIVKHGVCRDPRNFDEGVTLATLTHCHIRRQWIPNFIATYSNKDVIALWAEIECEFEFLGVGE